MSDFETFEVLVIANEEGRDATRRDRLAFLTSFSCNSIQDSRDVRHYESRVQLSCENFLNLSSYECLTQLYLTNLNWINKNLKFICCPFEVCIKIMQLSQAWTTDSCVCVFNIKTRIMTTSSDLTTCRKGTGKCCKTVCLAFSRVNISFSNNLDYPPHAEF